MLNVISDNNMKIENIFTLGFDYSSVYFSNTIVINETTGAIEYITDDTVGVNSCSDYEGIRYRYGSFTYYPIKFITISNKLSNIYETGKLFYYDKNKKLLGKISFTRNSTITIPVDNAVFVAFLLDKAQITTPYDIEEFCEMSTVIKPHYKSLKKQYKKESNQMFFRESIDGKINLFGEDYEKVKNAELEDMMTFNIYKNGSLFATNIFNKTDCKFDHFKKSVELKLTPRDKYTNVLDKYDKTYDLMKLAVGKTAIKLTKRSIIQIYIQGENTITNYSSGTYWEDEVIEAVNDQDALLRKYYFSKGPVFKEVSLSGFNYDINTAFACTDNDCWNGTSVTEIGGKRYKIPCSIKFTKIANKGDIYHGSNTSLVLRLSDGSTIAVSEKYDESGENSIYTYDYDTYRIDIYTGDNGTGQRIYSSTMYYGKDGAFTLKQGAKLYPMHKISQSTPLKEPEPASFNLGANVIEYQIWGRLLCDVAINSEGQALYDLPYDDFATERANFKKCIGLVFTQSNETLVHFYQKQDTQDEPTPWGINDFGEYFIAPFLGFGAQMFPYPLARSTWANTSLWVAFSQDSYDRSLEKWCRKFYKKIWHKDCMELGAIIKALLAEIEPSIKFESTAEYSNFFYGTVSYGYGQSGIRTYLTQKSNVLKGEYDQAAQKAEITFEKLMNLLRDCFRCYWFIDSEGRFRIEHVTYFMKGMSYDSPTTQYNLVNKTDKFNKKQVLYCQQEVSFAKSELNSRYEFAWADDVTEGMGGGFTAEIESNYIQKDKTENINIELATSDIDMMMFAPSKFSQDGFAIIMAKDYEVQIIRNDYYDQRDTYYQVITYTQNYYASFLSLFQHYMYDMPASSIHTSIDKSQSSPRYYVSGVKRCMEHNIEYQTMDSPDVYKLIGTDIGNGYVDDVSIDIDTHLVKITLTYEPR